MTSIANTKLNNKLNPLEMLCFITSFSDCHSNLGKIRLVIRPTIEISKANNVVITTYAPKYNNPIVP